MLEMPTPNVDMKPCEPNKVAMSALDLAAWMRDRSASSGVRPLASIPASSMKLAK
jgi:hypothetical protein